MGKIALYTLKGPKTIQILLLAHFGSRQKPHLFDSFRNLIHNNQGYIPLIHS